MRAQADAGMLARSIQGRDKGCIYAITAVEGGFAYVADGRRRSLKNPKKKNLKHLYILPHKVDLSGTDDCRLAYSIKQYKNSEELCPKTIV